MTLELLNTLCVSSINWAEFPTRHSNTPIRKDSFSIKNNKSIWFLERLIVGGGNLHLAMRIFIIQFAWPQEARFIYCCRSGWRRNQPRRHNRRAISPLNCVDVNEEQEQEARRMAQGDERPRRGHERRASQQKACVVTATSFKWASTRRRRAENMFCARVYESYGAVFADS